jgi:hypothetical protein
MSQADDERRLLRFIADRGGPAATTNVTGRDGEIGVQVDTLPTLVESLESKGLIETLEDGDVHLTALGRSLVETVGD